MPHQDLLLSVAHQRIREDHDAAARHRLARTRLDAFTGLLKLDWSLVRDQRQVVATIGFSWRRRPV